MNDDPVSTQRPDPNRRRLLRKGAGVALVPTILTLQTRTAQAHGVGVDYTTTQYRYGILAGMTKRYRESYWHHDNDLESEFKRLYGSKRNPDKYEFRHTVYFVDGSGMLAVLDGTNQPRSL